MTAIPTARGGTIDSGELGFTLMTECLSVTDPEVDANWPDILGDDEVYIGETIEALKVAKQHGVDTIVDRSIPGIGRDVARLKRIADAAPVNILISTGYYTWRDVPFLFQFRELFGELFDHAPGIDHYFERDLEQGVADTGVRAAILKAVTDRFGVTEGVEYLLRAVARAHRRTGAPISTHTNGAEMGLEQQRVFREEGVDLSRVYIGHVDYTPGNGVEQIEQLIEAGSTVSLDIMFGYELHGRPDFEQSRMERIVELCARGHASHMLLSHDIAFVTDLLPQGHRKRHLYPSYAPWTEITLSLIPQLLERGVTQGQIDQMMIENPRRIFESRDLGPY
jgi:phosphotriesterase-related protein